MENFKGTPGKWEKAINKNNDIVVRGGKIYPNRPDFYNLNIRVGHIYDDDCPNPSCCRTEEHANAQLIAHAPEMLEFIKSIVDDYENGLIDDIEHLAIRAEQLFTRATTV